jgi:ribulose-bisphosphate carboxylase large chain
MELLRVTYRLDGDPSEAAARAEAIALEQTVEVPRAALRDAFVAREIVGRVESVETAPDGASLATIAFPVASTGLDPALTLGVVFGNTSLQAGVQCVGFDPPDSLRAALRGPRFGLAGLRALVDAPERALTCTAVKPLGLSPGALADMLRVFARAGIDVVKDDQGLGDHPFCPFEARVSACLAAADEVADEIGRRVLYVPNLVGTPERVFEQLRFAEQRGARAVMVAPMLLGLPTFWELCHRRASVPVLAHPSHGGAARYAPELLFGRILRLYGADAVIFVGHVGRFAVPPATCAAIAANLRAPWGGVAPSLPVPGGGIEVHNAAEVARFYGPDTMLLVGGSLQVEADGLLERSRAFVAAVRGATA